MKKKSAPRSAFFIFRITAALCLLLSGIFLALLGSGAFSIKGLRPSQSFFGARAGGKRAQGC